MKCNGSLQCSITLENEYYTKAAIFCTKQLQDRLSLIQIHHPYKNIYLMMMDLPYWLDHGFLNDICLYEVRHEMTRT